MYSRGACDHGNTRPTFQSALGRSPCRPVYCSPADCNAAVWWWHMPEAWLLLRQQCRWEHDQSLMCVVTAELCQVCLHCKVTCSFSCKQAEPILICRSRSGFTRTQAILWFRLPAEHVHVCIPGPAECTADMGLVHLKGSPSAPHSTDASLVPGLHLPGQGQFNVTHPRCQGHKL